MITESWPTKSVNAPRAYLFKPEKALQGVIEKLLQHGIAVEELTTPLPAEVDVFTIGNVTRAERPFQNHREMKITGEYRKESMTFPAGTIIVRTSQPSVSSFAICLNRKRRRFG